jgi:hypothetical protein
VYSFSDCHSERSEESLHKLRQDGAEGFLLKSLARRGLGMVQRDASRHLLEALSMTPRRGDTEEERITDDWL